MPDDAPVRVRRRQNMIRAVNKELRTFPQAVQDCATAELARTLARELDAGDRAAAGELRRTLAELRKLAKPPANAQTTPDEPEEVADELDDIARAAAARLARAAGVVRPLDADVRRRRGGSAS